MIRSPNVNQQGERGDDAHDEDVTHDEGAGTFDRSFKYAVIAYAVVEFIAIALLIYYKFAR